MQGLADFRKWQKLFHEGNCKWSASVCQAHPQMEGEAVEVEEVGDAPPVCEAVSGVAKRGAPA